MWLGLLLLFFGEFDYARPLPGGVTGLYCVNNRCAVVVTKEGVKKLIKKKAKKYGLEFELVASIIWQESKGNPWASRVEEAFYSRYIEKHDEKTLPGYVPPAYLVSLPTEKWHRATSWGLMQVMGETMRERGFKKNDLTRLNIPAINLEYGCRFLKALIKQAQCPTYVETIKTALAAYNTGRFEHEDTRYDEIVLRHLMTGAFNKMFE